MKVLHINSNYLYTTLYSELLSQLKNKDIDNIVFMPHSGKHKFKIKPAENVIERDILNNLDRIFFMRKQKKMYECLMNEVSMDNIDIIHAHTLFTDGYLAYTLNKKFNIPYIVAIRNTDINYFMKYKVHLRGIGNEILKNAKKIIFISKPYKKSLFEKYIPNKFVKEFNIKSMVIPNGIDHFWHETKFILPKKIDLNNINILFAGRIDKNKNILTSIKAIKALRQSGLNINFTVVGDIKDNAVFSQIKKNNFVQYHKPVNKRKLVEVYRENDIFLMPSYKETFGLVYAEAMSQGLPVIYSKGQGFDEQFNNGLVGFSVVSNSVDDIKEAIVNILDNYQDISKNTINNVCNYDWKDISNQYFKIYSEAVKK